MQKIQTVTIHLELGNHAETIGDNQKLVKEVLHKIVNELTTRTSIYTPGGVRIGYVDVDCVDVEVCEDCGEEYPATSPIFIGDCPHCKESE